MSMLALLSVALASTGPLPEGAHWARFSRIPALARPGDVVRVGILSRQRDVADYWFERQVSVSGRRQSVTWTDTRSCPAAREQLARLGELAPRFTSLGGEDVLDVVADGASYVVDAPIAGGNGSMHIETTSRGPVRAWVDDMLAALEPCWARARPHLEQRR